VTEPDGPGPLWYLASPYTAPSATKEEQRFRSAAFAAAWLFRRGVRTFSPITHTHPLCTIGRLLATWEHWSEHDLDMISRCDGLISLLLPGHMHSAGLAAEQDFADTLDRPRVLMCPKQQARTVGILVTTGYTFEHIDRAAGFPDARPVEVHEINALAPLTPR